MLDQLSSPPSLTVFQLTSLISSLLGEAFFDISVTGEISGFTQASSGHRYFTLKDDQAVISCVLWKGKFLSTPLSNGMKVTVRGGIKVYPPSGRYQIDCQSVFPVGVGDLFQAFEALKKELAGNGYFDRERKKQLPVLPRRIGIATSPTGAVIHDILTTIERRFPAVELLFRHTKVQGEGSVGEIVDAIRELDDKNCDVLIVARGGGSMEDLWSFNSREVAEAIFNCKTPIISAVGHETDFTIADFVADIRAATPTAAAELCTPRTTAVIVQWLDTYQMNFTVVVNSAISNAEQTINHFLKGYHLEELQSLVDLKFNAVTRISQQFSRAISNVVEAKSMRTESLSKLIESLQPLSPLRRGFALVRKDGIVVKNDVALTSGDVVVIERLNQKVSATLK